MNICEDGYAGSKDLYEVKPKKKRKKSIPTLGQAKKDINAYIKLVNKEHDMWKKRVNMHKKELLRLADVYIKLKEKS